MPRQFNIKIYQEPIEFSLTFDGDTSDPTIVHDESVSIDNFLTRLSAAGWEVEKGVASQVDSDERITWAYELSEDGHAFDGDRGAATMEEARDNARTALSFIMSREGAENSPIELEIIHPIARAIEGQCYWGAVRLVEKNAAETGKSGFFIKGEEPHEELAKNGITIQYSHPFGSFEEAAAVFEKIRGSSGIDEYADLVRDHETAPRQIPLIVWPETGAWCHKNVLQDYLDAGADQNYVAFDFLEASCWNPIAERIEKEKDVDQGYYIKIEVQEFIRDLQIQKMAGSAKKDGRLEDFVGMVGLKKPFGQKIG